MPLVLAKPLGQMVSRPPADATGADRWPARYVTALGALMIVRRELDLDLALHGDIIASPSRWAQTPVAAVELLERRKVSAVFNAYQFGGYLISRNVPVTSTVVPSSMERSSSWTSSRRPKARSPSCCRACSTSTRSTRRYWPPMRPDRDPGQLKGWKRIYTDDVAVVHLRDNADGAALPSK